MDQNSSNGTDKRSWRERLGIGAGKDMPRIAEEFAPPAAPAAAAARPAVKPAPMAPRPGVKAAPPRGSAAAVPSAAAGEKLAEKLKAQREAQERLAEQRVQAARQRAEVKISDTNGSSGKPKFTFAGDEAEAAKPPAPAPKATPAVPAAKSSPPAAAAAKPSAPARQLAPPPNLTTPPIVPPRNPLGAERPVMPPRSPTPTMPPPVVPTRPPSRFTPPPSTYGSGPAYGSQVPPYRPMDPGTRGYSGGYTPPPSYTPTPPPVSGGYAQPRLNMPAAPASGYGADSYGGGPRTMRPPPRPAVGGYREEFPESGDVFGETRAPRRATAGDYSQAYRDEQDYEEDLPPSRGPLLPLILLFLLFLAAGLGLWWVYQSSVEKTATGAATGNAPVVEAPAQPAKVTPDPAPANNAPPEEADLRSNRRGPRSSGRRRDQFRRSAKPAR